MLKVGARIHRPNAERRCLLMVDDEVCLEEQTRVHVFISCMGVLGIIEKCSLIMNRYLEKGVKDCEIIHLSFNHIRESLKIKYRFSEKL